MRWRLLKDGPLTGARNMARDEAVARSVGRGESLPTLRLYRWKPPCLSLGYFQRYHEVNLDECLRRGVDVVRRPTGGRAVLHYHEVTYSVSLPLSEVPESINRAYVYLSQGLMEAFRYLGLEPKLSPGSGSGAGSSACFDAPSTQELLLDNRKAVGSAQVRRWGALLQHGSVPFRFDREEVAALLTASPERAERLVLVLKKKATDLSEAMGREPDVMEIEGALAEGFRRALGIVLEPGALSVEEEALSIALETDKYASPEWTQVGQAKEGEDCSI